MRAMIWSACSSDAALGSAREMAFLIGYASRLPYADWGHVAVAGHSAGAQASLVYASRGSTPVDAVVSLDTTQDYESLSDHGWTEFVPVVLNSSENMTMPILFAANAHAIFELADALVGSDRDLLTFKDLHHNDYISQGLFKRMLESWSDAAGKNTPGQPPCQARRKRHMKRSASTSWHSSTLACGATRHVRRPSTRSTVLNSHRREPSSRRAHRGWREGRAAVPRSRGQAPRAAAASGPLEGSRHRGDHRHPEGGPPKGPRRARVSHFVRDRAVYELLEKGRKQDAVAFHQLYRSFDREFRRPFFFLGKSYLKHGMKTLRSRLPRKGSRS